MNKQTIEFTEELTLREDVIGIILFGSWARGNQRPSSDVDLLVILKNGYQRSVVTRDGQIFELIYTTKDSALEYYKSHKDNCADLWSVAKILYDENGSVNDIQTEVKKILSEGKSSINKLQLEQYIFDTEDQINFSAQLITTDPTTANFILSNKIFVLTGLFFDVKQMWTPAPKQRLQKIKEIKPELYLALAKFYDNKSMFEDKVTFAKEIVTLIFEN